MTGDDREESKLRRVVPVAHRFSDGTWIVSAEVWDDRVVVRWAKSAPPRSTRYIAYADDYAPAEPPFGWREGRSPGRGWVISDEVGTTYALADASASGGERGFRGEVDFEPAPPAVATSLQIRHEAADEIVSVSLTD